MKIIKNIDINITIISTKSLIKDSDPFHLRTVCSGISPIFKTRRFKFMSYFSPLYSKNVYCHLFQVFARSEWRWHDRDAAKSWARIVKRPEVAPDRKLFFQLRLFCSGEVSNNSELEKRKLFTLNIFSTSKDKLVKKIPITMSLPCLSFVCRPSIYRFLDLKIFDLHNTHAI